MLAGKLRAGTLSPRLRGCKLQRAVDQSLKHRWKFYIQTRWVEEEAVTESKACGGSESIVHPLKRSGVRPPPHPQ